MRVRPDAGWLASLVERLEADPGVRCRLGVQANNLAVVRGPRIVVERRPHASTPVEWAVSVRNTEAVQLAVSLAAGAAAVGGVGRQDRRRVSRVPVRAGRGAGCRPG